MTKTMKLREKSPKSRVEIQHLVLEELRKCGGCEDANGVSVVGFNSAPDRHWHDIPNWTVSAFNAGASNDYECERALIDIVSRLQESYELVQKH